MSTSVTSALIGAALAFLWVFAVCCGIGFVWIALADD